MTLTEFLLARIADDEARVRVEGIHPGGPPGLGSVLAEWEERRWLAECEAKRRIVARHSRTPKGHWSGSGNCEGCGFYGDADMPVTMEGEICPELADLASVYADHPDYREEWRP